MIVDCAHYRHGQRQREAPMSLEEAAAIAAREDEGFVWLGLFEPAPEELAAVQSRFGLHELAVEDAQSRHPRPKIERYADGTYFVVLRTARYLDEREEVEFGEISLFLRRSFAITVRQGGASELRDARQRLEQRSELLKEGTAAVLWAVLDHVVDSYIPVVEGLERDIEEVEGTVFSAAAAPTERIYFLRREATEFYRAVHPLMGPLDAVERGAYPVVSPTLRAYFRDVNDHLTLVNEEVAAQRDTLVTVLQANMAVLSVQQNEVVRKISAYAAMIAVPTLLASLYGMNFDHMPELGWRLGYPALLLLMLAIGAALFVGFRRARWI